MTNEELTMAILKSAEAIKKNIQHNELLDYINNLQQENFNLRENILIHKMSFKSDDKSLEHLINMPSYEELQQLEQEHKKINGELRERIAYLERSNDRREDTILGLRQKINDVEDKNNKLEIALQNIQEDYDRRTKENERLKAISKKMHLWIFLHSGDEQKVYDELGLTDEENAILGYSGQIRIGSDDNE